MHVVYAKFVRMFGFKANTPDKNRNPNLQSKQERDHWWNDCGQNLCLGDFNEQWMKIAHQGFEDYHSLSRPERVWFNIQILVGIVGNGGLTSYFGEDTFDYLPETIEDLKLLGAEDVVEILLKMKSLFTDGCPPLEVDERWEMMGNWPEGSSDDLDDEFFKRDNALEKKLIAYLIKSRLVFPKLSIEHG